METISKRPRRCKDESCRKQIRSNNRSGYCTHCGLKMKAMIKNLSSKVYK